MYFGHSIPDKEVKHDPNKVKAVSEFPRPHDCEDIKSFLELSDYYSRFIDNFSKITQPLPKLLNRDAILLWKNE